MRTLANQIALLNHQVGGRVELRDVDLDCLDFLSQEGEVTPSALARRSGLHPATMTGVLDRLERGGWITRDRDAADRRTVVIRPVRDRAAEIIRQYAGMDCGMDALLADYDDEQLAIVVDFLTRAAEAGQVATADLAGYRVAEEQVHGTGEAE